MGKTIIGEKAKRPEKPIRKVKNIDGTETIVRAIKPSKEALSDLGMRTKRRIEAAIAKNPRRIEKIIARDKAKLLREINMMNKIQRAKFLSKNAPFDFVENKEEKGYKLYKVICVQCHDELALVWAKDETLRDWCDLHYITEYDKNSWRGCMTVQNSDVDDQLGFECACGEDTRDHRGRSSLPPVLRKLAIEYSMKHRAFGTKDSAFIAMQVK